MSIFFCGNARSDIFAFISKEELEIWWKQKCLNTALGEEKDGELSERLMQDVLEARPRIIWAPTKWTIKSKTFFSGIKEGTRVGCKGRSVRPSQKDAASQVEKEWSSIARKKNLLLIRKKENCGQNWGHTFNQR